MQAGIDARAPPLVSRPDTDRTRAGDEPEEDTLGRQVLRPPWKLACRYLPEIS
jgi:hypothetical protein